MRLLSAIVTFAPRTLRELRMAKRRLLSLYSSFSRPVRMTRREETDATAANIGAKSGF